MLSREFPRSFFGEDLRREVHVDGVVGVRLQVELKEWGGDLAEFLAVGTAVTPLLILLTARKTRPPRRRRDKS